MFYGELAEKNSVVYLNDTKESLIAKRGIQNKKDTFNIDYTEQERYVRMAILLSLGKTSKFLS